MDGSQEIIPLESAAMNESPASSILVVSADAETSAQAQQVLSDEIYDVTVVNDGSKALEQAAAMEDACELILLDHGIIADDEVLYERFVDRARGGEVPLLVLGPQMPSSQWARLLRGGASVYVTTPIDAEALRGHRSLYLCEPSSDTTNCARKR